MCVGGGPLLLVTRLAGQFPSETEVKSLEKTVMASLPMATKPSSHRQTLLRSLWAVPGQPSGLHQAVLALGFLPTVACPQSAWVGLSGQADRAQEFPTRSQPRDRSQKHQPKWPHRIWAAVSSLYPPN